MSQVSGFSGRGFGAGFGVGLCPGSSGYSGFLVVGGRFVGSTGGGLGNKLGGSGAHELITPENKSGNFNLCVTKVENIKTMNWVDSGCRIMKKKRASKLLGFFSNQRVTNLTILIQTWVINFSSLHHRVFNV